jgi:hypothetical protein
LCHSLVRHTFTQHLTQTVKHNKSSAAADLGHEPLL